MTLQRLITNRFTQALWQRLPALLNLTLVVVLGFNTAAAIWYWVPVPETELEHTPLSPKNNDRASGPVFHGAKIANLHLFGEFKEVVQTSQPVIKEDAPDTKLDLVLQGVLALTPSSDALAIIGQKYGKESVYGVGDTLPGNATLAEVYADRVIIQYRGRYETLRLLYDDEPLVLDSGDSKGALPFSQQAVDPISPAMAANLRREFVANPKKILDLVSIKPAREDGRMLGYQLSPKGDTQLFYDLGLRDNDIIVSVNGISISDPRALNKLHGEDQYEVVVLRDGAEVPLSLSFK